MLKNTFINRDIKLWKQQYTEMIRPHLEYAIQIWNPYQICDIARVQRRDTKIPKSLWTKSDSERFVILCLTTLEEKRTRGDLIKMYKIAKWLDIVEWKEDIELRNKRRCQHVEL